MNVCRPTEVESGVSLNFFPHCGQKFALADMGAWHDGQLVSGGALSIYCFLLGGSDPLSVTFFTRFICRGTK